MPVFRFDLFKRVIAFHTPDVAPTEWAYFGIYANDPNPVDEGDPYDPHHMSIVFTPVSVAAPVEEFRHDEIVNPSITAYRWFMEDVGPDPLFVFDFTVTSSNEPLPVVELEVAVGLYDTVDEAIRLDATASGVGNPYSNQVRYQYSGEFPHYSLDSVTFVTPP